MRPELHVPVVEWIRCIDSLAIEPHRFRGDHLVIDPGDDGSTTFRGDDTVLAFTSDEMAAFLDGVRKGEFTPRLVPA